MLVSGLVTFGIGYGAAAIVAAESSLDADHRMAVPFVGPWLALSGRGECGGSRSCDVETTNKVLIVADGVLQGLGALLVVGAFLNPETRTVSHAETAKPKLQLAPSTMGAHGYGLSAVGTF